MRQAVRGAAPLLALGIGRLVSTRASGYEVPLDEYGAHWNFYFTIAAVRAAAALLHAHVVPAQETRVILKSGVVVGGGAVLFPSLVWASTSTPWLIRKLHCV